MAKAAVKKWTILYYANGNNEYEPEMYQSLKDLETIGSDGSVNIVMQLGREEREVAEIIRASEPLPGCDDTWTGVRRYYVTKPQSILLQDLGKMNLADPKNFYDFIYWGMENYPAKHHMLIIGGHGASFVGTLTDYSHDLPNIMGTTEMCEAINMVFKSNKKKIDILILDICYMNLVEIMYELGKDKDNTIQNVITYTGSGPMSGLPYDRIVSLLKEHIDLADPKRVIKEIVDGIGLNLIGIEINHGKLRKIKRAASDLAYSYLNNKGDTRLTPIELLIEYTPSTPWYESAKILQRSLTSIILCYDEVNKTGSNLINIIYLELEGLIKVYYKLSFAKNNYWVNLLNRKELNDTLNLSIKESFKPTVMRPEGLRALIQSVNPHLDENEIGIIFDKLVANRKWSWANIDISNK